MAAVDGDVEAIDTKLLSPNEQGNPPKEDELPKPKPSLWKRIRIILFKNFLPLGLVILVVFGIVVPAPGVFLSKFPTHYICIVGIFLHSGIKLRTGEIKETIRAYKVLILEFIIIMVITPIVGVKLTGLLPFGSADLMTTELHENFTRTNLTNRLNGSNRGDEVDSLLGPLEFKIGIQLYFIVPCTISAGVVLVAQASGNSTLALITTVICNVIAVFTMPLMMKWLMSFESVKIDVVNLLVKLILTVLVPLLAGKGMRYIPKVKPLVKQHSNCLKLVSVTLLIMIPWMKVSLSSEKGAFLSVSLLGLLAILSWGLALHIAFMAVNLILSLICKFDSPSTKCVVVLASQKSLVVMVTVVSLLPFSGAEQGLITLPAIVIHLGVLVLDAFIVTWWHNRDERKNKNTIDNSSVIKPSQPQNALEKTTCLQYETQL